MRRSQNTLSRSVRTAASRRCGQIERRSGGRKKSVAVRHGSTEASSGGGQEQNWRSKKCPIGQPVTSTSSLVATMLIAILPFASMLLAGDAESAIDFDRDIRPIFQQHCIGCHGGVRQQGDLSLLDGGSLKATASKQEVIVAGKPEQSELIRRVTSSNADERMPAGKPPLSDQQIEKLKRWIQAGADWPKHWAFRAVETARVPTIGSSAWTRNPIDSFVLAKLESMQVAASPEADRTILIRRLYLDLLGLLPTPDEADAFVADPSPNAYEQLVDRLLANPHFGERWGRHWLDQARYADSDGYEVDKPRPDAYRWRDWVIAAVNSDMPLDQFTIEQFAGDLLPDATPQQHLATAYHRQTLTNNEGGVDKEEYRFRAVLDRVSNMGTVWLGLTLGCAQCHNHPYDSATQHEIYALAAIFNNAEEADFEFELPTTAPNRKVRVLAEATTPRVTRLLKRGDFLQPGEEVQPGVLRGLHSLPSTAANPNRLALAQWLVDSANPLTPRVTANQVWLHLFGRGLVRTPEDFGARGDRPIHSQLLDWLANELSSEWSRKALIRQIVLSSTYRQSSQERSHVASRDPDNALFARQNRVRVEGEIVRDLSLAAGELLSQKVGGPSVFPPLGEEFVKITFRSELPWKTSPGEDRYRRGMYIFFKRTVPYPDLMTFDCPDASSATIQRGVSNTPLQALTTLNAETFVQAARGLAARSHRQSPHDSRAQIESAFRVCLTREPSAAELERLLKLLIDYGDWYQTHSDDAHRIVGDWIDHKLPVSSAAALVATANILLNVDEFITRN